MSALLRLTAAEYRRYLSECRAYWPSFVAQAATTVIIFAVFFALSDTARAPSAWFGYLLWILASALISEAPIATNSEKMSGTLAQLMIKPFGFGTLIGIKTVVWLAVNLVASIATVGLLVLLLRLPVAVDWLLFPLALLGLASLFGFVLVLAGLTVFWSKSSGLVGIVSYALLFLTGTLVPLDSLPAPLQALGLSLPLTGAITAGRAVLAGQPITMTVFTAMTAEAVVYILLGIVLFRWVMRRAKRHGVTMRY